MGIHLPSSCKWERIFGSYEHSSVAVAHELLRLVLFMLKGEYFFHHIDLFVM